MPELKCVSNLTVPKLCFPKLIEFDIFVQETSTYSYIPKYCHHCSKHKMVSLNFFLLTSFTLTSQGMKRKTP